MCAYIKRLLRLWWTMFVSSFNRHVLYVVWRSKGGVYHTRQQIIFDPQIRTPPPPTTTYMYSVVSPSNFMRCFLYTYITKKKSVSNSVYVCVWVIRKYERYKTHIISDANVKVEKYCDRFKKWMECCRCLLEHSNHYCKRISINQYHFRIRWVFIHHNIVRSNELQKF